MIGAMAVGAFAALIGGWLNPVPWLLALLLALDLGLLWIVALGGVPAGRRVGRGR